MKKVLLITILVFVVLSYSVIAAAAAPPPGNNELPPEEVPEEDVIPYTFNINYDANACASATDFDTLVCGQAPDSILGLGAISMCNVCYVCGATDGVCPEDFTYVTAEGTVRGNCNGCPDWDCKSTVRGRVVSTSFDEEGEPIPLADVRIQFSTDYETDLQDTKNIYGVAGEQRTGLDGTFEVTIPGGRLYLWFNEADGFDPQVMTITPNRHGTFHQVGDIVMSQTTCHSDCTDSYERRCRATCQGQRTEGDPEGEFCEFQQVELPDETKYDPSQIANLCDLRLKGDTISLGDYNIDGVNTRYYVECCTGEVQSEVRPEVDLQISDIDNLITKKVKGLYRGELVDLSVVYWE